MNRRIENRIGRVCALLLAMLLGMASGICAHADAKEPRILRVGFAEVEGISEKDSDGTRHGMLVDYLNEIAKYTGWEYEYVDVAGEDLLDEFEKGAYDLIGGSYYYDGFEEYFAYPDYNTGYSKSVLLARKDDQSVRSYNLESLNGKTIGVYKNAKENIRRLEEFLSMNNLKCSLKEYSYEELSPEGNLYPYLESGQVDLLLGNGSQSGDTFRVVTSFDAQPYYIVTNVGNQEVLDGLNMALEKILDANPDFGVECYEKNFIDRMSADIHLNEEELAYIRQKQSISVAMVDNWHPLFCLNADDENHNGIVPEVLDKIEEFTGLSFEYVYADTYADAVALVLQGKADILGFYMESNENAGQQELVLSEEFVTMNSIVVCNKAVSYPDDSLVGAIVEGQQMPARIAAAQVRSYPSLTEALSAVNRGEVDFVYDLSVHLEQEIQRNYFSNLVPVSLVNDQRNLSFALPRPADTELLTILNKSINHITEEEKNDILNRNMVSIGVNRVPLRDMIYANPGLSVFVLAIILLLIFSAVLWVLRSRVRAAIMQNNLEKAEAENRAKGEFLSRMSHEIRTPMNAVVGLTELVDMKEGLSEDVRETLSKIRTASHYLLGLINDILDMSRIDSGMLTVVSEPFSLEQMLDQIQAIMGSEARRRGLLYTLEKKTRHDGIVGDAIRLRQVLTNLLSNAFKFTPAGKKVVLCVDEIGNSENSAIITFRVIDDGAGISPEDQQRIFETFEQLGTNCSRSQGTGLGLPISQSIVQMMGGELCVKSQPGQGSEFYFTITFPLGEPTKESAQKPHIRESDRILEGIRILLAEDNDLNAEIAVKLLEIQGASVHRSENGRLAAEQFAGSAPGGYHVILMDIQMPEMNGLEAARAIRAMEHPDAGQIPIIAMTANTFQEDVDMAMEAGMNGFIAKPLDVNYLYDLLNSFLK